MRAWGPELYSQIRQNMIRVFCEEILSSCQEFGFMGLIRHVLPIFTANVINMKPTFWLCFLIHSKISLGNIPTGIVCYSLQTNIVLISRNCPEFLYAVILYLHVCTYKYLFCFYWYGIHEICGAQTKIDWIICDICPSHIHLTE